MTGALPHPLEARALAFIHRHHMVHPADTVVCAVSGGADSVALLRFFHRQRERLGVAVEVAHLHHGIPEALSDQAAALVKDLAARLELRHHQIRVDVPSLARRTGSGLEAAGREVRLQWFRHLGASSPTIRVATAHTAEDQAETVLLRLLRGTGLAGLAGIRPSLPLSSSPHGPTLIRPLLGVGRADVRAYVLEEPWPLCEDPTNLDVRIPRNRIRHRLLPLLAQDFNPSVVDALCRLAAFAADDQDLLASKAEAAWSTHARREGDVLLVSTRVRDLPLALRARVWTRALQEVGAGVEAPPVQRLDDLLHGPRHRRLVAGRVRAERLDGEVALESAPGATCELATAAAEILAGGVSAPRIPGRLQEEPAAPSGKAP